MVNISFFYFTGAESSFLALLGGKKKQRPSLFALDGLGSEVPVHDMTVWCTPEAGVQRRSDRNTAPERDRVYEKSL